MATIAIGDVHGNLPALEDLLDQLRHVAIGGDVVVFLGDYIDRGPHSCACIEAIVNYIATAPAEVVCLRGNHEDWMLRSQEDYTRHSWLMGMDGLVTVRSYSDAAAATIREAMGAAGVRLFVEKCELPYGAFFDILPAPHRAFFDRLALSFKTDDCICSHGGLDPAIATLADQPPDSLIWGGGTFPEGYGDALPIVYGHWNNAELDADSWPRPAIVGNTIGIDTISHGVLTAVRMPDRRIFQSARHLVDGDERR